MSHFSDLLEEAVGPQEPAFRFDDLRRRAARRRRRRRSMSALASVLASLLVVTAVVELARDDGSRRVATAAKTSGVFADPTGVVLILDDGYDGVQLVDLDRRVVVRRPIEGQQAGDQPYRLTRAGDSIIVGWRTVYAAPLDGRRSRRLGEATISIPAAEADRVWLVGYPGGSIGSGRPALRLVDLTGKVVVAGNGPVAAEGPDPATYWPGIGVVGGMAFTSITGVALWDAASGQVTARLGTSQGFVSDVHGDALAWCEGECLRLHVRFGDGRDISVASPDGSPFDSRSARFSPDGRKLAAVAGGNISTPPDPTGRVVLIDVGTASADFVTPEALYLPVSLHWAPDGRQLFFNADSYARTTTLLGRLVLPDRRLELATLPFGGGISALAVGRNEVKGLLGARTGDPQACPPPTIQPSHRTSGCAFAF